MWSYTGRVLLAFYGMRAVTQTRLVAQKKKLQRSGILVTALSQRQRTCTYDLQALPPGA